ncbi:thiamine-phosphate kinase [Fulvivirga sediminis]|uniref:Thiamine-monophosphate kinase n=1 Tax=Fulvivirga sediminis TaxID=2803949 RepID=A0A937K087_9BACT|nr:thiamine-phosphate kinase [Fulvivirga sediminis]MBL3656065.1 thiamine-phosphate kinase [Fulvivirga sediminis]
MSEKRTEIGQLGEFGLIDKLSEGFSNTNSETALGIGDDAALIDSGDHYTVLSTDMLLEGIHFDLSFMPLQHLGYKAVAVNVSDIAAMNAVPKQITVSLGLSNRFSVEAVEELYKGVRAACDSFKVDLVGGDTTSSGSGLVISVTAVGVADKSLISKRSGAQIDDVICVTGDLGGAYMGLQVLEREKQVFMANPNMTPQLEKYDYIVQRQLRPEARMDIIHELKDLKVVPSAMIDVSDGLASELFHISKQSQVGMKIYEDKLPIDKQTYDTGYELNIDATTATLNGGEDYELLFTVSKADMEKLKKHPDIHFIGYVQEQSAGNIMITKGEREVALQAQGWNHFNN